MGQAEEWSCHSAVSRSPDTAGKRDTRRSTPTRPPKLLWCNYDGGSVMLDTVALSPALGAEVVGADDALDDAAIGRCLEALMWRSVLLIRGRHFDDEGQLAMSRKLGTVLAPGGKEIFKVSLDPSKNPA